MSWIAAAALVVLASFAQSAFGFGFALVFTPLASVLVGTHEAVATAILLIPMISLGLYWEHRPREPVRTITPLVVPAVAAFPLGLVLLVQANEQVLRVLVGVAVAAGAAVNLFRTDGRHEERPNRVPLMLLVGVLAGVLSGATSMGGPAVVLYQHWVGGAAAAIRRRLFAFFAFFSLAGIPIAFIAGVLTPRVWGFAALGLPAVAAGIALGRTTRPLLSDRWFGRLSMTLLVLAASTAVIGAVMALT